MGQRQTGFCSWFLGKVAFQKNANISCTRIARPRKYANNSCSEKLMFYSSNLPCQSPLMNIFIILAGFDHFLSHLTNKIAHFRLVSSCKQIKSSLQCKLAYFLGQIIKETQWMFLNYCFPLFLAFQHSYWKWTRPN